MTPSDTRHGTYAGAVAHQKAGERHCPACREARRLYMADYRARQMPGAVREQAMCRARGRALWRLADLHPAQFDALLADEMAAEEEFA